MGFWGDAADFVFGGATASTNPADYYTPVHDRGQIMGAINQGMATNRQVPESSFRNAQVNQIAQLQGIASGQQKGAGELAAQRQAARAVANQQAMARMGRGGNAALAYRNAAGNTANIGLAASGMGQQAAMQDQMNAQGLLANVAGQARGQDLDSRLKMMGMDDAQRNFYMQQLMGLNAQEQNAQLEAMKARMSKPGAIGGILQGLGGLGGLIGG